MNTHVWITEEHSGLAAISQTSDPGQSQLPFTVSSGILVTRHLLSVFGEQVPVPEIIKVTGTPVPFSQLSTAVRKCGCVQSGAANNSSSYLRFRSFSIPLG